MPSVHPTLDFNLAEVIILGRVRLRIILNILLRCLVIILKKVYHLEEVSAVAFILLAFIRQQMKYHPLIEVPQK